MSKKRKNLEISPYVLLGLSTLSLYGAYELLQPLKKVKEMVEKRPLVSTGGFVGGYLVGYKVVGLSMSSSLLPAIGATIAAAYLYDYAAQRVTNYTYPLIEGSEKALVQFQQQFNNFDQEAIDLATLYYAGIASGISGNPVPLLVIFAVVAGKKIGQFVTTFNADFDYSSLAARIDSGQTSNIDNDLGIVEYDDSVLVKTGTLSPLYIDDTPDVIQQPETIKMPITKPTYEKPIEKFRLLYKKVINGAVVYGIVEKEGYVSVLSIETLGYTRPLYVENQTEAVFYIHDLERLLRTNDFFSYNNGYLFHRYPYYNFHNSTSFQGKPIYWDFQGLAYRYNDTGGRIDNDIAYEFGLAGIINTKPNDRELLGIKDTTNENTTLNGTVTYKEGNNIWKIPIILTGLVVFIFGTGIVFKRFLDRRRAVEYMERHYNGDFPDDDDDAPLLPHDEVIELTNYLSLNRRFYGVNPPPPPPPPQNNIVPNTNPDNFVLFSEEEELLLHNTVHLSEAEIQNNLRLAQEAEDAVRRAALNLSNLPLSPQQQMDISYQQYLKELRDYNELLDSTRELWNFSKLHYGDPNYSVRPPEEYRQMMINIGNRYFMHLPLSRDPIPGDTTTIERRIDTYTPPPPDTSGLGISGIDPSILNTTTAGSILLGGLELAGGGVK